MSKDVVVITGGAGGIGSVCGYKLDGYKLVIADFNKEALDSAVQKMLSAGIDAVGFESDITDQNSVNALVTFTKELGTFKGLIHTAGVSGTVWKVNSNPEKVFPGRVPYFSLVIWEHSVYGKSVCR